MTLRSLTSAIARFLHLSPPQDTTVADNAKIQTLTQQLQAATAKITTISQQLATTTADLATARHQAADAVAAAQAAEQNSAEVEARCQDAIAKQADAESKLAAEQAAHTADVQQLQAQLDAANQKLAALPDADVLAANETAQQALVDEVAKAQGTTPTGASA